MKQKALTVLAMWAAVWAAAACRGTGGDMDPGGTDLDGDADSDTDGDADSDTDGDADSDTDGDADGDADSEFQSCGTTNVNLSAVATRVMLLEDKSGSMDEQNKWSQAVDAIETMVGAFENQIEFGLDLFNISDDNGESCEVGTRAAVDAALSNGQTILDLLDDTQPSDATPLLLAMENFLDDAYAPQFSAPGANRYLVIVSDGMDTCGEEGVYSRRGGADARELAAVAADLADEEIGTIVIGFGDGADGDQLNAIAEAGGTEFDTYIEADDGDALTSALNNIAETVAVSCVFELNNYDAENVNTDRVNVLFDGTAVPRDEDCNRDTGWTWADDERTVIEFCEAACAQIEAQTVSNIQVEIACSDGDVVVI